MLDSLATLEFLRLSLDEEYKLLLNPFPDEREQVQRDILSNKLQVLYTSQLAWCCCLLNRFPCANKFTQLVPPKRLLPVCPPKMLLEVLPTAFLENRLPPDDDAGLAQSFLFWELLLKMLEVATVSFFSAFLVSFDLLLSEWDLSYLLDSLPWLGCLGMEGWVKIFGRSSFELLGVC